MENGTALQYVMQHPEEDIINIVSRVHYSVERSIDILDRFLELLKGSATFTVEVLSIRT